MSLAPGTRIGAFEIQSPLGAGGMGEVYRARDTKLGRQVAVKILPDDFLKDPARVARFQREAQALAALNHPHIAQIYGFDDTSDIHALVMELVEGPTLADRIAQGPIPLDEALPIAHQLAEALEAAHEQGIIHRDLKPANIKIRPDGTVKVLDFGLAKLADAGMATTASAMTQSPTITSPAMMTGAGMLLGTAAYMAPEQARGKTVDKRADIWAFGCVLYEMLTGSRAFAADEVSDTLAMVLIKEQDWSLLPVATPPAIRTLLRRCLEKDRKRRLPDVGVARLEIEDAIAAPAFAATNAEMSGQRRGQPVAWIAAAIAGLTAASIGALHFTERPPQLPSPIRFQVVPPADASFPSVDESGRPQAISPDGRHIAFQVLPAGGGPAVLAIRSFDADQSRQLPGTEEAAFLFWSPDSRFIGFFAGGKLKKMDIAGGPPQIVCDVPQGSASGGTWNQDGIIVFGQANLGLLRVSSGGGTPVPVTTLDATKNESRHLQPWFLPDGRHFLYYAFAPRTDSGTEAAPTIYLGSLDGGSPVPLIASTSKARYANGFLLFVRDETLLAQPFDDTRLVTTGDPTVIAQDVPANPANGSAAFSVSTVGVLSYRPQSSTSLTQLTWLDRAGRVLGTLGDTTDQAAIQLSPDGSRVALSVLDPARRTRDLWLHDLMRQGLRTRFTFDAGEDWNSVWSPDGRSLVFSGSRMESRLDLYRRAADGSGTEVLLPAKVGNANNYVTSWSPDGRHLLYHTGASGSQTGNDLWVLPLTEEGKPRAFLQTPFVELDGQFSPDGRWVAYVSNESGRNEIYVMSFLRSGGKWLISSAGGTQPDWRRDGRELFYLADDAMMAAEINVTANALQVGAVRRLFEVPRRTQPYSSLSVSGRNMGTGRVYDVTSDGQRFLVNVISEQQAAPPPITVITNWTATLR